MVQFEYRYVAGHVSISECELVFRASSVVPGPMKRTYFPYDAYVDKVVKVPLLYNSQCCMLGFP